MSVKIVAECTLAGDVYVPALWQAPLLKSEDKYPVVIISHGIGGNRTTLSTYSCELASHGFVVASLEHRSAVFTITNSSSSTSSL